jgi:hypothetical protein
MRTPKICGLALGLLLLSACASDSYLASAGHSAMRQRQYERASTLFEQDAKKATSNKLLFILDQGSALFAQGRYDDAIQIFLKAEDVAEIKDYTSISEEVGTLATSSNVKSYKGEDFEKVMINVYLALSFAALGKVEGAQVEARKINLILNKMITEGKRNYEESPFARYLSGILWEMNGSYNSAYIDYKKTYEMDNAFPDIGRDLLAMSKKMRFNDEYKQWTEIFPNVAPRSFPQNEGELIVVFEKGLSPIKVPRHGQNSNLPRYIARHSAVAGAKIKVNGEFVAQTETVLDIETLSIRYLEDRIARMAAAKMAGVLVKGAVAAGIGAAADDGQLGELVFRVLLATDRADLRSWRSLPADLSMVRIPLPAGSHRVELIAMSEGLEPLFSKDFGELQIQAGKKRFVVGR